MTVIHVHQFINEIVINTKDNIEFNIFVERLEELKEELDRTHKGHIHFIDEGK